MKRAFSILLAFFIFGSFAIAQTNDADLSKIGEVKLPDITENGIGSSEFHQKGVATLGFLERFRLDLKSKIELRKASYNRVSQKTNQETPTTGEKIDPEKTVKDLESANNNFMYYFLVFALFVVSHVFFFYGLIVVIILLVLKTLLSSR